LVHELRDTQVPNTLLRIAWCSYELGALDLAKCGWVSQQVKEEKLGDIAVAELAIDILPLPIS